MKDHVKKLIGELDPETQEKINSMVENADDFDDTLEKCIGPDPRKNQPCDEKTSSEDWPDKIEKIISLKEKKHWEEFFVEQDKQKQEVLTKETMGYISNPKPRVCGNCYNIIKSFDSLGCSFGKFSVSPHGRCDKYKESSVVEAWHKEFSKN